MIGGRPGLGPRARLVTLVVGLLGLWVVFGLSGLVSREEVRAAVDAFGPFAPVAFVVIAAGLALALVPGWLLAGTSGVLFGTWLGFAVTLASAVLTSVCALMIGRHAGRDGVREFGGHRVDALEVWLERHGVAAVVIARLAPPLPDAPVSYAAGTVGLAVWQIALGTVIGAAPRALAYSALGDSIGDLNSPRGIAAAALLVVTFVVGAELLRRTVRRSRSAARAVAELQDTAAPGPH